MKRSSNLVTSILGLGLLIAVIPGIIYAILAVYSGYDQFVQESEKIREEEVDQYKGLIKHETEHAVHWINYMRSTVESRLKDNIRERVYEAHAIASAIWEDRKGSMSAREIAALIKTALRPIRYNGGRGYYFATNMDGTEELFADHPEMEGLNFLDMRDGNGAFFIRDMIELVRTHDEGFIRYMWFKPGNKEKAFPKIAFVKYFKPLDWFIGTGEYLDDVEEDIKRLTLKHLEGMHFQYGGYVFVGQYDGLSLSDPAKGKNMLELQDPNGVWIVKELIEAAKAGGGYVRYILPKFGDQEPKPKISYAMGLDDWQWYVGAGIFTDAIEQTIALKRQDLYKRSMVQLGQVIAVIVFALLLVSVMLLRMWRKIRNEIDAFGRFFTKAAEGEVDGIRLETLHYEEFRQLGDDANEMLRIRRQNAKALVESEERFRLVIESMADAMHLVDHNLNITLANRPLIELCRSLGLSTDLIGKRLPDVFTFMPQKDVDAYRGILETGKESYLEDRFEINGRESYVQISRSPVFKDGRPHSVLTIIRDVTRLKVEEQQRKDLEAQLQQSQKMEAIGRLAGGVAHDFNNLLTAINGNVSLALMDMREDDPFCEVMRDIGEAADRAGNLTRQLLAFSRKQIIQPSVVDLNALIERLLKMLGRLIGEHISLKVSLADHLPKILVDVGQLEQVIINLAVNARDAMKDGGELIIQTSYSCELPSFEHGEGYEGVVLTIRDTGVGMDAETRAHIFEPFFSTKAKTGGTGLGLAMSYGIVKQHNGHIDVDSNPGEGTRFRIIFPPAQEGSREAEQLPRDSEMPKGRETVLFVEDDAMVMSIGVRALNRMGYHVLHADKPEEAIRLVEHAQERIDLVVTDVVMPEMNGKEMAEAISKLLPGIKVLYASGYTDDILADHGVLDERLHFIHKPYTPQSLAAKVRAVLDE